MLRPNTRETEFGAEQSLRNLPFSLENSGNREASPIQSNLPLVQTSNSWAMTLLCINLAAPVQLSRLQKAEGPNRLPGEVPIYRT